MHKRYAVDRKRIIFSARLGTFRDLADLTALTAVNCSMLSNYTGDGEQLTSMAWRWAFFLVDQLVVVRRAAGRCPVLWNGLAAGHPQCGAGPFTVCHRASAAPIRPLKPINRHDTHSRAGRGAKGRRSRPRGHAMAPQETIARLPRASQCDAQVLVVAVRLMVISQWIQLICTVSNYNY